MSPTTGQQQTPRRRFDPECQARLERHRAHLLRLADLRKTAAAEERQAIADTADTVLAAVQDGMSMMEAEDLTELSRPTLYRHVAAARKRLEQQTSLTPVPGSH